MNEYPMSCYWRVSYFHSAGYRVSRPFDSRADAQEFIDNNAMVYPLPGVKLIDPDGNVIK